VVISRNVVLIVLAKETCDFARLSLTSLKGGQETKKWNVVIGDWC